MEEGTSKSPTHCGDTEELPGTPFQWDAREDCEVRQILDRIADKWSLLVIALLERRRLRFTELMREIDGVSQRMLTVTLRQLERDGLVARTVHPVIPPKVEYELTPLGRRCTRPSRPWSPGPRSTSTRSPPPARPTTPADPAKSVTCRLRIP